MERAELAALIGGAIKQARTERAVSQGALAKALSIDQGSVSAWETGRNVPPVERLRQVEQALDMTPGSLTKLVGFIPVPGSEIVPPVKPVPRPARDPAEVWERLATLEQLVEELVKRAASAPD